MTAMKVMPADAHVALQGKHDAPDEPLRQMARTVIRETTLLTMVPTQQVRKLASWVKQLDCCDWRAFNNSAEVVLLVFLDTTWHMKDEKCPRH